MRTRQLFYLVVIALLLNSVPSRSALADQGESSSNQVTRLPEVSVTGETFKEDRPFGANNQPEWSARRPFANTRVYVQPPWQFESESSWDATWPKSGAGTPSHILTQEFELGLPHRFQVDYEFAGTVNDPDIGGHARYSASSLELRYALADWGRIPLNPAIKGEWKFNNAQADGYELNLALAEEITARWHWAANFFFEQQVGDNRTTERTITQALGYTIVDEKFSVGGEMKLKDETDDLDRHSHLVFEIGPSIQWRPCPHTHLDLETLFGTTGPSPVVESFVFFGIDFGPGSEGGEVATPISSRNK